MKTIHGWKSTVTHKQWRTTPGSLGKNELKIVAIPDGVSVIVEK